MAHLTESVTRMVDEFAKLPGIGRKSAERLAYHILRINGPEALALADAIRNVKENVRYCQKCYHLAEQDECDICRDPTRVNRDAGESAIPISAQKFSPRGIQDVLGCPRYGAFVMHCELRVTGYGLRVTGYEY